jgi:carboxypeptidase Q
VKRSVSIFILFVVTCTGFVLAQEPVDQQAISKFKMEGFQKSKVMETVSYLTDVHGPRLTGSPNLKAASEWSRSRLAEWGLANAHLEPWGTFGRGWSVKKISVEMVAPQYMQIIAYPKAWTPGTNGLVTGKPIVVNIKSKDDFEKYRGKLRGAIVMNGAITKPNPHFDVDAKRYSEQELSTQSQSLAPEGKPYLESEKEWQKLLSERDEITKFFYNEGIAILLEPSERDHGVVRVMRQSYKLGMEATFPALVIAKEHFGRIVRLLEKNVPVDLEINIQNNIHEEDTTGYNVIAEIPGTDPKLKDEIVMLGAHLDSWHSGTGATDNAAGCAVMMEAVRILKAAGVNPRRTIRIALWSGEEQGFLGSLGYVKKHFGNPETMEILPEHEKLSAYFNLDNGTGKIRGVHLQGNEAVRPIFEAYLQSFNYLGASTLTANNTGGTDHVPFDAIGLPGFQFIQDPIEYGVRTHHTNMDVYESLLEDDLKQSAVIIATFAYHTAMRNDKLPRKPLVKAN